MDDGPTLGPTLDAGSDSGEPASSLALAAGARVGRFRLLAELGAGGMGVVWAAHDEQLDREVALKFLTRSSSESSRERLQREARSLARLAHPHVVAIYDAGVAGEGAVPYLAMEYVRGRTLRAWLGRQPTRLDILAMFVRVGRGLAAAHEVGVVHRDFKPDNVIVGDDERPRVLDFGLARVGDERSVEQPRAREPSKTADRAVSLTRTGAMLGTPAYMAPEQWEGQVADARTDQFAFCVALFEALYGTPPFPAHTTAELMTKVLDAEPLDIGPADRVPAALHAAILRGLAKDPAQRWPSLAPLLDAIDEVLRKVQPGLFGRSPLAFVGFAITMVSTMWLLPLTLIGLEWAGVVPYRALDWLLLSGAQILIGLMVALANRERIAGFISDVRLVAGPAAVAGFVGGHRIIALVSGSSIELMFAYDYLALVVFASVMTYLVERALWVLIAFNTTLLTLALAEPSWAPRLWCVFTLVLPIVLLGRAAATRNPLRQPGGSSNSGGGSSRSRGSSAAR